MVRVGLKWQQAACLLMAALGAGPVAAEADKTEKIGAYHLSLYQDVQGSVLDLEAYTKDPEKSVFFGVTCSAMSPFPAIQILLFEEAIISETPRLLSATYEIDGKVAKIPLQAVLQAELTAELSQSDSF